MQVAMFTEPGKVELQDIPRPTLKEGEVLVEIEACGLCATDVKSVLRGHPFWKPPRVLGHEMVGRVVEINGGADVSIGDRVFVCPLISCGHCFFCRRESEKMCLNKKTRMPYPGGFSEYVSCPAPTVERGLLPVPERLSSAVASLSEPFGCAVRAMKMTRFDPGACVLIVGDGPMGLLNAAAARFFGAGTVILSGTLPHRLEVAAEHYADIVVNINDEDLAGVIKQATEGHGADAAFVAISVPEAVRQSINLVRPGGSLNVFAGQPAGATMELDLALVHYKEITVNGTFGATPREIYEALMFMASGRMDFSPIVTRAFSLAEFMEAMQYSVEMKGLRAVIVPDGMDPFKT